MLFRSGFNYIPYEVLSTLPIEINASFNLEVDDYETKNLYNQLNNDSDTNFAINIKGTVFKDEQVSIGNQDLAVNGTSPLLTYRKSIGVNIFNVNINKGESNISRFNLCFFVKFFISLNISKSVGSNKIISFFITNLSLYSRYLIV